MGISDSEWEETARNGASFQEEDSLQERRKMPRKVMIIPYHGSEPMNLNSPPSRQITDKGDLT